MRDFIFFNICFLLSALVMAQKPVLIEFDKNIFQILAIDTGSEQQSKEFKKVKDLFHEMFATEDYKKYTTFFASQECYVQEEQFKNWRMQLKPKIIQYSHAVQYKSNNRHFITVFYVIKDNYSSVLYPTTFKNSESNWYLLSKPESEATFSLRSIFCYFSKKGLNELLHGKQSEFTSLWPDNKQFVYMKGEEIPEKIFFAYDPVNPDFASAKKLFTSPASYKYSKISDKFDKNLFELSSEDRVILENLVADGQLELAKYLVQTRSKIQPAFLWETYLRDLIMDESAFKN